MSAFLLTCVWEAAVGNPAELTRLLRSDFPLSDELRNEIALLVEGKLVPKKRGRGRPRSEKPPSIAIADWTFSEMSRAIENYHRDARWLARRKKLYGNADNLATAIARKWGIEAESFLNALHRLQIPPKMKLLSDDETARFEQWLAIRNNTSTGSE